MDPTFCGPPRRCGRERRCRADAGGGHFSKTCQILMHYPHSEDGETEPMENFAGQANYVKRLTRVTSYIYDHLDDDLDLQILAEVAALSPFHWRRIYHALYGETVAATVKRLRLQRAAAELARTSMAIEEIATRSGYETVASFNRAFKSAFGMPPAQFRREGIHARFKPQSTPGGPMMYDVAIVTVPLTRLAVIDHVGPYILIGKAFDKL